MVGQMVKYRCTPARIEWLETAPLICDTHFVGLTYHFKFGAPADVRAEELQSFLKSVERDAQKMGFHPTLVLNVEFDTPERRDFVRRLTTGLSLEDERLKGVALPGNGTVWEHNPRAGCCRILPESGVVLVVTDERGRETLFGFFKYAEQVMDIHGHPLAETGLGGRWHFRDFMKSPDPRFRRIVQLFRDSGYLEIETDEFQVGVV